MSGTDADLRLIERIADGDEDAVRLLVQAKLPRVFGLAARMLRDPSDAEDVSQEVFLRVWRHARRWRPGQARFDTWLHTVTLNLCRDRLRRRRDAAGEAPAALADAAPDGEACLMAAEREQAVADAIAGLPERQREAIVLLHYQELSGSEAAGVMGITVEALESLLARGRRKLQAQLMAEGGGDDV